MTACYRAMRTIAKRVLFFSVISGLSAPTLSTPTVADDSLFRPERAASLGLYLKLPFGQTRTSRHAYQPEFGIAMRIRQGYTSFHGHSTQAFAADVAAVRFTAEGFNRFSLSGRDIYLRGGALSFYANGDSDADDGGVSTGVLVGLGAVALGAVVLVTANAAADRGASLGECVVNAATGQTCD